MLRKSPTSTHQQQFIRRNAAQRTKGELWTFHTI